MLPLEQDENSLYLRVQELCNSLANSAEQPFEPDMYIFSLSSHKRQSSEEAIRAAIDHSRLGTAKPTQLTWITRGEACWWAGGVEGDGVVVKAGTVGFAHAFGTSYPVDLTSWRAGGWGLLSGNDGGAYSIGRRMLYRLFEEEDGRREDTAFSTRFARLMREHDTFGVVRWIRQHKDTYSLRVEVARLAQTAVFLAEQEADDFCRRLLRLSAGELANCLRAAARFARNNDPEFGKSVLHVLLQGRLVQNSALYSDFVCSAINRRCTAIGIRALIQPLHQSAVLGCLQRGLSDARWPRSEVRSLVATLATTVPGLVAEFSAEAERAIRRNQDDSIA